MLILFHASYCTVYIYKLLLVVRLWYFHTEVYIYVPFCEHKTLNQRLYDHMTLLEIKKWVN